MRARNDFYETLDVAAGFVTDASCACREASLMVLPAPHRHHLKRALAKLEAAQAELWKARNTDFWEASAGPRVVQLSLL